MEKITLTEVLVRLKTVDKRIAAMSSKLDAGFVSTKTVKGIPAGHANLQTYLENVRAGFDKFNSLVDYRDRLKSALVEANARTQVRIGSKVMSIAQAIEQKTRLANRKAFLNSLEHTIKATQDQVQKANATLDMRADDHIQKMFAGNVVDKELASKMRETWVDNNTMVWYSDPVVTKTYEKLKEEVTEFEDNVNVALTLVNSTTFVEV